MKTPRRQGDHDHDYDDDDQDDDHDDQDDDHGAALSLLADGISQL